MTKVLVTGSQGFIGSYICQDLLAHGYDVVGVDNYSKYGYIERPQDNHPNFYLYHNDVSRLPLGRIDVKPDIIIAGAAMIGGIEYFHKYAYDLLAENERILADTFDFALELHQEDILKKIVVMSSSMVFESTDIFPSKEEHVRQVKPPLSTYGFQKLSVEYFCQGACQQYGLPYNIVRPFNCVGVGEDKEIGNNEGMMLSHVLPDLITKILDGQDPLHILGSGEQTRCYTNGKDIARGIRLIVETDKVNEDYNISSNEEVTVLELAERVWKKLNPDKPFRVVHDEPYLYDVQKRIPDTTKAKEQLGFEATFSLDESIDEVIGYIKND